MTCAPRDLSTRHTVSYGTTILCYQNAIRIAKQKFGNVVLTDKGIGSLSNLAECSRCDTASGVTRKGWEFVLTAFQSGGAGGADLVALGC